MRRRNSGRLLASVAWIAVAGGALATLPAQAPAAGEPVALTTPDGSRVVLLPDARMPLVHWAIATVAEDPPGFSGLSAATMRAALGGTWRSGSRDPARERQALDLLDSAFRTWLADRDDMTAAEALQRLWREAEQFGDPTAHRRALAAVPMHRPEAFDRPPLCLYVTSTVPDALPEVAQLVLERREHTALRDLQTSWILTSQERGERLQQDEHAAVLAEVLALAMPEHPFLRQLERAAPTSPQRSEAMAVWQTTQRPERTVHVLLGGFDGPSVRALLERTFAATALPPAEPLPIVQARPFTSLRRSVVPGVRLPCVALGFALPAGVDRAVLDVAARWLADGPDSRLGQELPRLGHPDATIACRAPWPPTIGGQGLLLLEVTEPNGTAGLADLVRRSARDAVSTAPPAAALDTALANVQREWTTTTNDPRQFAVEVAAAAQLWPGQPPRTGLPDRVDADAVRRLLAGVLSTQPVVVEGRP